MTARHHHYLSQCYLKGFTDGGSKNSKLTVIDFKLKKQYQTTPRNVGGIRDFNRIDVPGVPSDFIETALSELESKAATAIKKLIAGDEFSGETKTSILKLIALLAIRSPERRENWRQFHQQIARVSMGLLLETEDRWQHQIDRMREDGHLVNDDVTYEQLREFVNKEQFQIEVSNEYHISTEFTGMDAIYPYLENRNWTLITTTEACPFLTTDHPVMLNWVNPEEIPVFYRNSPGFGLKGTEVYFPVSATKAIIGSYIDKQMEIDADENLVAILNSRMMHHFHKQVYAPKLSFKFHAASGQTEDGHYLILRAKINN